MKRLLHPNLIQITRILSDGCFHDGNSLGLHMALTRSAVWKVIKKLIQYGINVRSVKGKGYVLADPLLLLDQQQIANEFLEDNINIEVFETIPSTNAYLKALPLNLFTDVENNKLLRICLAEHQSEGRGRFNRVWSSPFGKNLYVSCLYPLQKDMSELSGLSLVVALAIANTLKNYGVQEPLVKWPNDIVYKDKKLAGILLDIEAEGNGMCQVVIGMGININMQELSNSDAFTWISLQQILGKYIDRNKFCIQLIKNLQKYLNKFNQHGFVVFKDEWFHENCLSQIEITIKKSNLTIDGFVHGINEHGHLLLKLKNGEVNIFTAGDVTVKKEF